MAAAILTATVLGCYVVTWDDRRVAGPFRTDQECEQIRKEMAKR